MFFSLSLLNPAHLFCTALCFSLMVGFCNMGFFFFFLPCASPEYASALPKATEYRVFCPATIPQKAIVPTANPDTVFDIKYFTRDQRRNRPPIRKKELKKADVEAMMKQKKFEPSDFPRPYLTATIVEDENARGGGYQK